jgi:octanoyl-[GcvH]:protein N-octanoyltransferase
MQENAHNTLRLIRRSFATRPAFGTAVSEAILIRVANGELPATFRLHRPARELAFAKQDRVAAGFAAAVDAASGAGFAPVLRLAGGRAAIFHEGTLAISWARPDPRPVARVQERFREAAEIVAGALGRLGVDARIGELEGEWCPGTWSVNARGRVKLAGIGQRMIAGAAHVGGVVVAEGGDLISDVLAPVYEALELDWDPATAGSAADESPGVGLEDVEEALIAELGTRYRLEDGEIDTATLELAATLEAGHEARPLG